jgi:hypothetical protein
MSLKPWREVAIPHKDVLHGTFQESEFAADLSQVHQGIAKAEIRMLNCFLRVLLLPKAWRYYSTVY